MKHIGEVLSEAVTEQRASATQADPQTNAVVRFVFGRMHGAYGAAWLDKWRTGVLDKRGRDMGVASAMVDWAVAIAPFDAETITNACEAAQDEAFRKDAKFPPSRPEFISLCKALRPRQAPSKALPHLMSDEEKRVARLNLATMRAALQADQARGRLGRLEDLIAEAVVLAGGGFEDLTAWQMVRQP